MEFSSLIGIQALNTHIFKILYLFFGIIIQQNLLVYGGTQFFSIKQMKKLHFSNKSFTPKTIQPHNTFFVDN